MGFRAEYISLGYMNWDYLPQSDDLDSLIEELISFCNSFNEMNGNGFFPIQQARITENPGK